MFTINNKFIIHYNQKFINYYNFHFFKNLMQQIKKLIEIKISKFQFQKFYIKFIQK